MKQKTLSFAEYEEIRKFSYNQMCRFIDGVKELTKFEILGKHVAGYVLDEEAVLEALISVPRISPAMAQKALDAIEAMACVEDTT